MSRILFAAKHLFGGRSCGGFLANERKQKKYIEWYSHFFLAKAFWYFKNLKWCSGPRWVDSTFHWWYHYSLDNSTGFIQNGHTQELHTSGCWNILCRGPLQDIGMSVTTNSPSQDSFHPHNQTPARLKGFGNTFLMDIDYSLDSTIQPLYQLQQWNSW